MKRKSLTILLLLILSVGFSLSLTAQENNNIYYDARNPDYDGKQLSYGSNSRDIPSIASWYFAKWEKYENGGGIVTIYYAENKAEFTVEYGKVNSFNNMAKSVITDYPSGNKTYEYPLKVTLNDGKTVFKIESIGERINFIDNKADYMTKFWLTLSDFR